jgi:hypothetical protein
VTLFHLLHTLNNIQRREKEEKKTRTRRRENENGKQQ